MPRRALKRGRRASGKACPRGAWARWCSPGRLSSRTFQPRHLSSRTLKPRRLSLLTAPAQTPSSPHSSSPDIYRSSRYSVGMPFVTLCVKIDAAPRTQERTQSVRKGVPTLEHGHDGVLPDACRPSHSSPDTCRPAHSSPDAYRSSQLQSRRLSFLTLRVGMPFVTLCVTPVARQVPAETPPRSPGCRAVDRLLSSCAVR